MKQEEWGVDIVTTASQKALMCPPGIGLISVSPKAWKVVERDDRAPRFFWDFKKAREAAAKSETAFTSPVSLIMGLEESLEMIREETLPHVLARHKRLSSALRAGCEAMGLAPFGNANSLSPTVVVVKAPQAINGDDIIRGLYEHYGTVIAGSRNKLSGKI